MPRKTQYEIAVNGLTRAKVSEKTVNILNPGQRSDAMVVFPTAGFHPSALFELRAPQTQDNNPVPNQPAQNPALAAILGLVQNAALGADPLLDNQDASYTATLGTVDERKLGVFNGPRGTFAASHVSHIHVNPFEVMDITNTAKKKQEVCLFHLSDCQRTKVFWFFFSKRNCFLAFPCLSFWAAGLVNKL